MTMGFAARISKLGGVLRSALGAGRRCCCVVDCPDGCTECGECCFSPDSQVTFTFEAYSCHYDRYPYEDSYYSVKHTHDQALTAYNPDSWAANGVCEWRSDNSLLRSFRAPDDGELPSECEYVEPTSDPVNAGFVMVRYVCATGEWWVEMPSGSWEFDVVAGGCDGISESEFRSGGFENYGTRLTIEVIDNDDCMAV